MKVSKCVFLFLFTVLNFTQCAAEDMQKPLKVAQNITITSESDMLSEFEDEIKIEETYDPLSGYNRVMTDFNDKMYVYVFTPLSDVYTYLLNKNVRESIDNFFNNIYFPVRFVNNALQGKFKNSAEETGRFAINSTLGIFGLFDVAKKEFDLQEHNEDFGQTLGFYGVKSGPHIVLPLFGPSNLRDTFGMLPDSYLSPLDYKERKYFTITDSWSELLAAKSAQELNSFSINSYKYEEFKKDAIDLYPYLRDVYEQYRDKQIEE